MAGDVGDVICRGANPFLPGPALAPGGAAIDHVSYGIAPWDVEKVREALEARGLTAKTDTATAHTAMASRRSHAKKNAKRRALIKKMQATSQTPAPPVAPRTGRRPPVPK